MVGFNTQPPEGGCPATTKGRAKQCSFNTQPPEGGCVDLYQIEPVYKVSTHSRPKAAAARTTPSTPSPPGFNTQPPEGGCKVGITALPGLFCFNTQPPEGGCLMEALIFLDNEVSTHSRPKAATELSIIVTI